jgi:hypothetical protein
VKQWDKGLYQIRDLKPQEKNPRRISKEMKEQLKNSILKFGVPDSIIINHDLTIIGGHQRYYTLKAMGEKMVMCMRAVEPLTPQEVDELTIRLNKNRGEFDFDLLANGYDPECLIDWGFTLEELHLEQLPEQEEKPKTFQLTAKFENEEDLRQAEIEIAAIIDLYASASYKVKVK